MECSMPSLRTTPHTVVDKECEFGLAANGISGLETAFGALMAGPPW